MVTKCIRNNNAKNSYMNNSSKINLIVMPISVEAGMAGTARLKNFIDFLPKQEVTINNLVFENTNKNIVSNDISIISYNYQSATIWNSYIIWFEAAKELKKRKKEDQKNIILYYDTIHNPFFLLLIILARMLYGYKIIFDLVEDYQKKEKNLSFRGNVRLWFSGCLQRNIYWLCDGAIGISDYLIKFLKKRLKKKPIIHLPISFNPLLISKKDPLPEPQNQVKIFYGGTFGEKDGINFLIQGFEEARRKSPNLVLNLTGKASKIDADNLQYILQHCEFRESINYLGYLDYSDYCKEMGAADVLCMTRTNSSFANAGFPFKLGEYLATGKPVVVSKIEAVTEYLSDQDCFFVKPESSKEIARAFIRLTDPDLRNSIGKSGQIKAFSFFDARKISAQLFEFLKTV